jgi:Homeodomain-like domain
LHMTLNRQWRSGGREPTRFGARVPSQDPPLLYVEFMIRRGRAGRSESFLHRSTGQNHCAEVLNRVQFQMRSSGGWRDGRGFPYGRGFDWKALSVIVLRVDHDRWGQTQTDLREMALNAAHARSRERFLALYDMAQGDCATRVALRTGRHPQTVMGWLHAYNEHGPEALTYQRTGGRPPFVQTSPPRLAIRSVPHNVTPPVRRSPERM